MNIMRKILSVGGSVSSVDEEPRTPPPIQEPDHLGLAKLKQMYEEYLHPTHPLNESERESKLYLMLPVFCQVFSGVSSGIVSAKIPDIIAFTQALSRLLVTEVRRRASNQSTEAAADAIAKYMEVGESEETSNGWMLLSALNILGNEGDQVNETMTAASVPSTLVKCLYLFFDLPPIDSENEVGHYSPKEKKILLQKMTVQILIRLSSFVPAVEELARKDDLTLLFSAVTSNCPAHNIMWRKTASDILLTISRQSFSQSVISYLHNKGCISLCVDNMHRSSELSPLEIVEMFVTVFCFLKDSAEVTQILLDDFRTCQGYAFLSEFLLKLESDIGSEANEAIRNLVLLVASLSFCGTVELTPNTSTTYLYQLPGFEIPEPDNRGNTVRNIPAFQVLQTVFLKSSSNQLGGTILDGISTVYTADDSNYFILENQHTLPQCAEKISMKPLGVQEKFFQLIEFVVFHLKFVPCKEFVSISLLLKAKQNLKCCVLALKSLFNILKSDPIFKDVFREIGFIEVIVGCLKTYSNAHDSNDSEDVSAFGKLSLLLSAELISGTPSNAAVFRESKGSPALINLVKSTISRELSLSVFKQLVLIGNSEEDFTLLLELIHSFSPPEIEVKVEILTTILGCLKESHRCRTTFRRIGGYVYIVSILVSMEGSLSEKPSSTWSGVNPFKIYGLIERVFACLTVSMRYEPANAKYFETEISCCSNWIDTLRLLGCFSDKETIDSVTRTPKDSYEDAFKNILDNKISEEDSVPRVLASALIVCKMLYDMATDKYENKRPPSQSKAVFSLSESSVEEDTSDNKRKRISSLSLQSAPPDPIVVHARVITVILKLLPSLYSEKYKDCSIALQSYISYNLLKSPLRTEKNQQIMSDIGFLTDILHIACSPLEDEAHLLHAPFQYLLERLAAQKLKPLDLRTFFRLGNPLCCREEELGSALPLTRIKTLVSMTTPRDSSIQNNSILPPFVEFDMSLEGFGCLFLPSLSPTSPHVSSVVGGVSSLSSQESGVIGGIGEGDRSFPPQPGLSFSTWICVDKFSDSRNDPHPIRLLTLFRQTKGSTEENSICFSVSLSARDRALLLSTKECPLTQGHGDFVPDDSNVRIWFPDLIKEGEWNHVVVVLNRQVLKNSSVLVFINGQHIHTGKMSYINTYPNGSTPGSSPAVFGYIGTPPIWRKHSRLCWKQGPCLLYEEISYIGLVSLLYRLGPHYLGSLQAPQLSGEVLGSQIPEERIIIGLNAVAMSSLTLNKIKKVYSKIDNKSIARQLSMTSGENATPIRIIHNSASHLLGSARSLGGVIIGYLGVRVFSPQPVSKVIQTVGGCNVILGIIAMASNTESLYAGVKALVCVLKSNPFARYEMEINRGYQILGMLLRKKTSFLSSNILHLIFSLAGTLDLGDGYSKDGIPNLQAFRDVLCDLDLWTAANLEKYLFENFYELSKSDTKTNERNVKILRDLSMVEKLLIILKRKSEDVSLPSLLNLLHALLVISPRVKDVLCFALFTAATLPVEISSGEKSDVLDEETLGRITLRNRCLELFCSLLYSGTKDSIAVKYCEDVVQVVGFDWVLLFLQGHLHPSTTVLAMKILSTLLSNQQLYSKFRSGVCNGHWLNKSDLVLRNKMVMALGPQSSTVKSKVTRRGIRQDIFGVPGYQFLNWLISHHHGVVQNYYYLCSMAVFKSNKKSPPKKEETVFDLDSIWKFIFGVPATEPTSDDTSIVLNTDGLVSIFTLIRTLLSSNQSSENAPSILTQFLFYLYFHVPNSSLSFMSDGVLSACVEALFPKPSIDEESFLDDMSPQSNETPDSPSMNRSTKKNILHFLKNLIVDSLSVQATPKSPPIIDTILDTRPEKISQIHYSKFQTELLSIVMDHLLALDVLIGEGTAIPIIPSGNSQYIAPNVFYLASRLVDKLWSGVFHRPPEDVFAFILKLISQAKRRTGGNFLSLEGIFRCLNRTILYMIIKPFSKTVSTDEEILEILQSIISNRSIIFGAGNHELEFFGSLTFCIIQILSNLTIPKSGTEAQTIWYKPDEGYKTQELDKECNRIWEELYISKKPALEEAFKTTLSQQNSAPPLIGLSITDSAFKIYNTYIHSEIKGSHSKIQPWEFHTQLQSKLQKVTGGLTGGLRRLTSVSSNGSKPKKSTGNEELTKIEPSPLLQKEVEAYTLSHVAIVKEVVETHYGNRLQTDEHMLKFIEMEWLKIESRLIQERGLWGPYNESPVTKWMLDMTEGPLRMRKKMIRNAGFFLDYPYREAPTEDSGKTIAKYKRPTSFDSKIWYDRKKTTLEATELVEDYDDCDVVVAKCPMTIDEQMQSIGFQGLKSAIATAVHRESSGDDPQEDNITSSSTAAEPSPPPTPLIEEESSDYQTVMQLLEDGEKICFMHRCTKIQGLDTAEGLLLFGREHFYILDGFTLINGREVHDIDLVPNYEPIIPVVPGQVSKVNGKREIFKFAYDNIREVHKRRYLLQPIAVEIFSFDGQNKLLAFPKNVRPKIYQRFLAVATSISDSASASVAGQRRSANVEQGGGLFSALIGETSVTQRWVRGEITNFQYLMALNTLAGRSYNDLMQYPVFPWILSNYKSEELDLTDPANFRDLSKPMGAQSEPRLKQFMNRYSEWDDPHNDSPPYHYGTHYSSAMIVSSYLVRCEPFTQHFLHLQGGYFDLADRMFHSIEEAWDSASRNNMADLRELIPEFFYLPDFFVNHNNFDLGIKQNGEVLDDVVLPSWAKGSPEEFIRVHREALESDYVSSHLHEWIDLIFGYKQMGDEAIEAVNVFHHLFYEGNVDIFAIEDPLQRNATIGFINNFGQTPKNLFKKPHPPKKIGPKVSDASSSTVGGSSKVFFHNLTNLRPSMTPIKELKGPVGQIVHADRTIHVVEHNKVLVPGNLNRYLAWGNNDQSFRLCNYESDKVIFVCEPNYLIGQVMTCDMPNSKTVITAGTSSVVAVYEYQKKVKQLHIKKLLYGHTDAVTCLTASPAWNIAVSGSRDSTAIIWDLSRYTYVKHLVGHVGPIAAVAINELTGNIVTSAGSWLYLWDINGRLQASVNTADPHKGSGNNVNQQILCVSCSQFQEWDRQNVIMTGSSDGVVRMWSLDYVETPIVKEESPNSTLNSELNGNNKKMSICQEKIESIREVIAQTISSAEEEDSPDEKEEETEEGNEEEEEEEEDDESATVEGEDVDDDDTTKEQQSGSRTPSIPENSPSPPPPPRDDFVMVSNFEGSLRKKHSSKSGDGYIWTKQLIFRAKLTMHTAFDRPDNTEPAAVTALAISKDHKIIYVGDEKGRVFSWTVSNKPGKGMVDHWWKDNGVEECTDCGVKFTIYERKHHCRSCGKVYCSSCSQYQAEIPKLKIHLPVRVCKICHEKLSN